MEGRRGKPRQRPTERRSPFLTPAAAPDEYLRMRKKQEKRREGEKKKKKARGQTGTKKQKRKETESVKKKEKIGEVIVFSTRDNNSRRQIYKPDSSVLMSCSDFIKRLLFPQTTFVSTIALCVISWFMAHPGPMSMFSATSYYGMQR